MVVADGSGLYLAATRRLQLAAEAGGTLVVLVQAERGRQVVVQACGRSERAGVKAGMSLA